MLGCVDEDRNRLGAVGEEGRADALALAAVALVADGRHGKVNGIGMGLLR